VNEATHIKPLTAVRFFAALWVVLFHYWPKLAGAGESAFVSRGYLGVELFFVLSGFILCHVYLPAMEDERFKYGSVLWARIARVYPLHIVTLLGVGALAIGATVAGFGIDPAILSWSSLPANLLMVQAWGLAPEAGWNHPSWSISAEWFAYLTFPLFGWAALSLKTRPLAAFAGACALLTGLYAIFPMFSGFPLTQATIAWGALRIVPCFALGCAAYLVWRSGLVSARTVALALSAGLVAAILVLAHAATPDAVLVMLFGGLMVALAALTSTGSKVGTGRVGVYLGEISYAMYMVCVPWKLLFVNAAAKLLGIEEHLPLWLWLIFIASVVPLAALAHHLVERPARTALKTLAERRISRPKFA
jgi:peptidoglycan/LPS O-acetylase OafA/YrhL